jgi:glycosidase
MQWNAGENAGFSQGKPWLGINANYKYINYTAQKNDPNSILTFYKTLIHLRKKSECLKYGEFIPHYADRRVIVYQRKLNDEIYMVALNFSSWKIRLPNKAAIPGTVLISNTGRKFFDRVLLPWEGVLLEIK